MPCPPVALLYYPDARAVALLMQSVAAAGRRAPCAAFTGTMMNAGGACVMVGWMNQSAGVVSRDVGWGALIDTRRQLCCAAAACCNPPVPPLLCSPRDRLCAQAWWNSSSSWWRPPQPASTRRHAGQRAPAPAPSWTLRAAAAWTCEVGCGATASRGDDSMAEPPMHKGSAPNQGLARRCPVPTDAIRGSAGVQLAATSPQVWLPQGCRLLPVLPRMAGW